MNQLEIKELQPLIIEWANKRNLNDSDKQYLKIQEELGETAKAILHNNIDEIKDGIGDIAVTIIIYYKQKNIKLNLNNDYEGVIQSDYRSFININLSIIKESDLALWHLSDFATSNNTTLKECLNLAWNEIKHREGKTVNGTFIKN